MPAPASTALLAIVVVASCTVAGCTRAGPDRASGPLRVVSAWARSSDAGTTGGAYVSVTNVDTMPVVIVGLSSSAALSAELHESTEHDGMVHMMARPSLRIAPESTLAMRPGGLHVMLNGLTRALVLGDSLTVTFILADGRQIPVPVAVRNDANRAP